MSTLSYAMLKGTIKRSLFIINQYSFTDQKVVGLTAFGDEAKDHVIQFIPFTVSLSLTLYRVISISYFLWRWGGAEMNQLDGYVCKCASDGTCNKHVTFFGELSYLSTLTVAILVCCTRYHILLQLPEF